MSQIESQLISDVAMVGFYSVQSQLFLLLQLNTEQTRLIQNASFSGFTIAFASLEAIEKGCQQMNLALKQRAEQRFLQNMN